MNTEAGAVYRHSGKFGIHGPVVALTVACVLGYPLGFAYAYLMKWIPFIYARFVITAVYGLGVGFGIAWVMKWAKVRNTRVAFLSGLLVGILVLYFEWNAY